MVIVTMPVVQATSLHHRSHHDVSYTGCVAPWFFTKICWLDCCFRFFSLLLAKTNIIIKLSAIISIRSKKSHTVWTKETSAHAPCVAVLDSSEPMACKFFSDVFHCLFWTENTTTSFLISGGVQPVKPRRRPTSHAPLRATPLLYEWDPHAHMRCTWPKLHCNPAKSSYVID